MKSKAATDIAGKRLCMIIPSGGHSLWAGFGPDGMNLNSAWIDYLVSRIAGGLAPAFKFINLSCRPWTGYGPGRFAESVIPGKASGVVRGFRIGITRGKRVGGEISTCRNVLSITAGR